MMHHRSTATAAAALAIALCASLPARAQTARLGGLPASAQVVTNEQDAAALAALNAANAVLSAAITNEAALRTAGDAAGLAALYGTNAVLRAALTNEAALRAAGDAAGLAALYGTNAVLRAALTNEAALRVSGTNEAARAALRAYHYGSPDIVESPAEWFNGQGTIIGFISGPGRTNAVIPWAIGGVAVTNIGSTAFYPEGATMPSTYHFGRFVRSIGAQAFFYNTDATHLYFSGDAPTVGANAFFKANGGLTATVINPQAKGWGATLSDGTRSIPVVRPTLSAESIISAAPAWQVYTNIASSVTITNDLERPVRIYGDGSATGTVSFAALREPLPVYVEASGFPGIVWSNAYTVGGGFWQTNAVNVFLIWQSGTNIFVNPVTARPL